MAKITFIGAGSTVFARNLLGDILGYPGARRVARSRCSTSTPNGSRPRSSSPAASPTRSARPPTIEATTDRRAALDGADYAINMIQVGGYKPAHRHRLRGPEAVSACARPSPTRSASAASCAACAPSRCCSTCAATWRSCAPT